MHRFKLRKLQGDLVTEAFVEQWFDDQGDARPQASASAEVAVAWEDVGNYAKTSGTSWIVKEHVIIPPAPRAVPACSSAASRPKLERDGARAPHLARA